MSAKWKAGDLIDLEYFLQQEDELAEENIEEDREVYLSYLKTSKEDTSDTATLRKGLYKYWLENRKNSLRQESDAEVATPGKIFEEVYRLFVIIFLCVGVFLGAGGAFHLLSYDGTKPVNVTTYIGLFVICQILLVITIITIGMLRGKKQGFLKTSIIYKTVAKVLIKAVHVFNVKAVKTVSQERRNELEAAIGLVKGKHRIYGEVFYWPVFVLIQIGSIGFNAGVIGATLLRVLAQDLAFGWASTIQFSAQTVYSFVKTISIPWSWFISHDIAFPTLTEIEGSRILLKNGIYHLSTQDLVSWWPFLCLSVVFYGFLPRVIFLCIGMIKGRKVISGFTFDTAACEKLMIRMHTPRLKTKGNEAFSQVENDQNATIPYALDEINQYSSEDVSSAVMLIPTDIFSVRLDRRLNEIVPKKFNANILEKYEIGIDPDTDQKVIQTVAENKEIHGKSRIFILQEAWQPPIQETRMFIEELRQEVGKNVNILVMLVGKPIAGDIFTPAAEQDKKIWKSFIDKIGDPHLWAGFI